VSVRGRREGVAYATGRGLSQRRACTLLSVARSALAYQPRKPVSDATVLSHMGELARRYPKPTSWYDLLDPRFRGRITMPDPSSSGTGYFHVSAWIQLFGEEEAWRFMDRLHANIRPTNIPGQSLAETPRLANSQSGSPMSWPGHRPSREGLRSTSA